jgi:hypothetical protein
MKRFATVNLMKNEYIFASNQEVAATVTPIQTQDHGNNVALINSVKKVPHSSFISQTIIVIGSAFLIAHLPHISAVGHYILLPIVHNVLSWTHQLFTSPAFRTISGPAFKF